MSGRDVPEPDRSLGVYDGQPVMAGHHGRLVYDVEPRTLDGCLIPVPADFLGLPRPAPGHCYQAPEPEPEAEPEAGL